MAYVLMGLDVCSFMRKYRVQLAYANKEGEQSPINQCVVGPRANTKEFPEGVKFQMNILVRGEAATIEITRQPAKDMGVRYLPWEPNYCVYTRMDGMNPNASEISACYSTWTCNEANRKLRWSACDSRSIRMEAGHGLKACRETSTSRAILSKGWVG